MSENHNDAEKMSTSTESQRIETKKKQTKKAKKTTENRKHKQTASPQSLRQGYGFLFRFNFAGCRRECDFSVLSSLDRRSVELHFCT